MALLAEHHHCNPQGPQASPPPAVGLRMESIGVIDPVRLANPASAPLSILRSSELAQLHRPRGPRSWGGTPGPGGDTGRHGETGTDVFWCRDRSSPDAPVKMSDGWASFWTAEYIRLPPSGPACIDCTAEVTPVTSLLSGLDWAGLGGQSPGVSAVWLVGAGGGGGGLTSVYTYVYFLAIILHFLYGFVFLGAGLAMLTALSLFSLQSDLIWPQPLHRPQPSWTLSPIQNGNDIEWKKR